MAKDKVVLAYSGGLDTSVAIKWLQDKYDLDVIAVALDVGQPEDLEAIQKKALDIGAIESLVVDATDEFVANYIAPSIKANALYERVYPVTTSLSRPLIGYYLVEVAKKHGAGAIAHGCTGKGNDQVRIETAIMALHPGIKIIAPQREWAMSREEAIDYAQANGIEIPVTKKSPYSVDENLWGRSVEAGILEDPWLEPPPDAYTWTKSPEDAPADASYVDIGFEKGLPNAVDAEKLSLKEIILKINKLAGASGIGRIDMVENRLVGIKSREIYECPAAIVITAAHQALESLTLTRELTHYKFGVEDAFSRAVYFGHWFSPLTDSLNSFIDTSQEHVTGNVRLKFYKGSCTVAGRKSRYSLYDLGLATYDKNDEFTHMSAEGFIDIWGLPNKVWAKKQGNS